MTIDQEKRSQVVAQHAGMHVAWVDDEELVRYFGQKVVTRCGATCVGFPDHAALLDASNETHFDAAILQPWDDIPALEVLQLLGARGTSTVILSSGAHAEDIDEMGIPIARFSEFLEKPWAVETVIAMLELAGPDRGAEPTG